MFGLFKKPSKRHAMDDIEQAMLQAYEHLENAKRNPDVLCQRAEIVTALAALLGAIREAYPEYPLEDKSLGVAIVEANADGRTNDLEYLLDGLFRMMDRCPATDAARDQAMTFIVAPTYHQRIVNRSKATQ